MTTEPNNPKPRRRWWQHPDRVGIVAWVCLWALWLVMSSDVCMWLLLLSAFFNGHGFGGEPLPFTRRRDGPRRTG